MQTLVTGGSGFIGQHLVAALLRQGRRVRILDLRPPTCDLEGAQFLKGSVLDPAKVREAVTNVEEVYHLAALPGMWVPRMQDFHTVNCLGTEAVIAATRERGVSRLLHCSQNRFSLAPRTRIGSLPNTSPRRLKRCRAHMRVQKCQQNSALWKLQHLAFLSLSPARRCLLEMILPGRRPLRCCNIS